MADDVTPQSGASDAPKTNNAEDAALKAAQDAISQLGDLNNLMADATGSGDEPTPEEAAMLAAMAGGPPVQNTPIGGGSAPKPPPPDAKPLDLPSFEGELSSAQVHALELLSNVNLNVKIELGRTRMLVEDVLRLSEGAVVELDKLAGDPVDVYVNERHVARGEVLVLNDNFCVRINEILSPLQHVAEENK
ncbi:MAG TPA: flagellar motor switch protein FliN [Phycisphaerales bacterium]|nr:flagellar motor switch protein FliN [Phycisphaerales bacterium]